MKRSALTIVACLAVVFAFGQKRAIKDAKSEANAEKPNYADAMTLIKGTLENPETKDLAEAWFTAGWIENKAFDDENKKQILGQTPDLKSMYLALYNIKGYFEKADELDQLPDDKGKVKPKYRKDMMSIMKANHPQLVNGGAYFYEAKDYPKAYDFFKQYLTIPDMVMFKDEPLISKTDSLYLMVVNYTAICAVQMHDHQKAINAYEELKAADYNSKETYKFLASEYDQVKDTANFVRILQEGASKFSDDMYFLLNLINQYIYSGQKDEAVDYLLKAVEQNPNDAQLYSVLGTIYEERKEIDKAQEYFDKSIALNPNSSDAQANIGRIYFNNGVILRTKANDIADNKKYMEELEKSNAEFRKALPYFEKAHQLKPEEKEYLTALKNIYYNLKMGKEYDAVEAKLVKLQ